LFEFLKKKPQKDKVLKPWANKRNAIEICIEENKPDFKFCYGCKMTAACNRIKKSMGV